MFDNMGSKLKKLAIAMCWLGMIASLIVAIVIWSSNTRRNPTVASGFGFLLGGCVGSWIGSFTTYAFGIVVESSEQSTATLSQLLEEQKKTNEMLARLNAKSAAPVSSSATATVSTNSEDVSLYLDEL